MSHPAVTGRRPVLPAWAARAAALAVVTLAPIRWRADLARYRNNWRPQLVPLWNLVGNLRDGDRALAILAGAAGNVALFLPRGFLLSVAIELSQVAFPGVRRADVNDVLMNTLGTALGFLAWRLATRRQA